LAISSSACSAISAVKFYMFSTRETGLRIFEPITFRR
jgi:hypothetical protein